MDSDKLIQRAKIARHQFATGKGRPTDAIKLLTDLILAIKERDSEIKRLSQND